MKTKFKKKFSLQIHKPEDHKKSSYYNILAMRFNSSQRYLATAGMDQSFILSDMTKNLKQIDQVKTKATINALCFTEKQNLLCTGLSDNDVEVYDIKKGKVVIRYKNHQDQVLCLEEGDDNLLISASQDRTVKVFDLVKHSLKDSFLQSSAVMSLQVSNNLIHSGHYNGSLRIHSQKTRSSIYNQIMFEDGQVHFCKVFPHSNKLVLGAINRIFKVFDLRMMKVSKTIDLSDSAIFDGKNMSVAFDEHISKMFCGTNDGKLASINILGKTPLIEDEIQLNEHFSQVPLVIYSNLHESVLCADFDGNVHQLQLVHQF